MGIRHTAASVATRAALIIFPFLSACSEESATPVPASESTTPAAPVQNAGGTLASPEGPETIAAAGGSVTSAQGGGVTDVPGEGQGGALGTGGMTMQSGGSGGTLASGGSGGSAEPKVPLKCDAQEEPANILFVLADDQSFDTIAAHGNTEIKTPNLDKLAARGVSFTRAYNMGSWSGAVCIASRTMFNTGRFLWKANALDKGAEQAGGRIWSQALRDAGYKTYMSGKWHVGGINAPRAFERTANIRPGMPATLASSYNRPIAGQDDPWSPYDESLGGFWDGGKHWSEVLGDDAETFLSEAKASDDPFFMYLAFNAPHDPRQSPKEYVDMYPSAQIAIPKSFLPVYPFREEMASGEGLRDERLAPFPRTEAAVQIHRQEYYAIITHMDAQIGRMLTALEASGKADNTYIIFTADHGLAMGHHGLMGKQNMFEHSMRSPMIVVGPGLPAGAEVDAPVYIQDVVPTTLDIAKTATPSYVDFKSLLPLACGEREKNYERIYGAYLDAQRMASDGRYKLIHYPAIDKTLLFDLETDPDEMVDLAAMPEHADRIQALRADLAQLEVEMGG